MGFPLKPGRKPPRPCDPCILNVNNISVTWPTPKLAAHMSIGWVLLNPSYSRLWVDYCRNNFLGPHSMPQAPQVFLVSLQVHKLSPAMVGSGQLLTCPQDISLLSLCCVWLLCGTILELSNTAPPGPWLQTCFLFSGCTVVFRSLCLLLASSSPCELG